MRRFTIDGLPEGCAIALELSGTSADEEYRVEGAAALEVDADDPRRVRLVQRSNGPSSAHVAWPGPLRGARARAPNTLTPAEEAAGWRLLFDGTTTNGWRRFGGGEITGGWEARDGTLARVGPGGDIVTADRFDSFELALEWKISPRGNSGIFYRVEDGVVHSGPEMQVLDNAAGGRPEHAAGACYDMYAPSRDVTRPVGAWNTARVVARGDHIEHWLNGVKVVEYDLDSPEWRERYEASKYREKPWYAARPRGHIMFQDHGNPVAYRNIRIRPRPGTTGDDAP